MYNKERLKKMLELWFHNKMYVCIEDKLMDNLINKITNEQFDIPVVDVMLKDKEETDSEIKSLRDLKEAYPDGTNYTIRGFGKLIMYFVDNEEVYVKHL